MKTSNRFHLRSSKRKNPKGKSPMSLLAVPSEAKEQAKLNEMIAIKYPELIYRVGMEAGKRNPMIAKQQGLTSGWTDLHFPYARQGFHSLWIELKRKGFNLYKKNGVPKDERISNQLKIIKELNTNNNYATFAFGAEEAMKVIDWYFGRVMPFDPKGSV